MKNVWEALTSFLETYHVPLGILSTIILALLVNWVLRFALHRGVNQVVRGVKRAQDNAGNQDSSSPTHVNARAVQRTRTLGTVGRHIISWVIVVATIIAILSQMGVNLTAMLASAGIFAAALAFGAQNLVKDILNGVFMVFEDQLGVGDLVTINDVNGTVEDVGIRVTKVRAVDGTLWFIRNGEILTLGNASQGWGRAIIDLVVSADTDFDKAGITAMDCVEELIHEPEYARRVTGEPELVGLQSVYGDRATLRIMVRTRPEAQYAVQRELLTRITKKYEEDGITLADEQPKFPGGSA